MAQKTIKPLKEDSRELLSPAYSAKKQKKLNYLSGFAMGIIAVGLGILLYWSFTGHDVLVVKNSPAPVKPLFVKAEETITVSIDVCKVNDARGIVYTRFVSDKTELVVPTYMDNMEEGCYDNYELKVPIPPQLTPDVWYLRYRIDYNTNPITTVREEFETQKFTVIE